jgi:hypothetical protein
MMALALNPNIDPRHTYILRRKGLRPISANLSGSH